MSDTSDRSLRVAVAGASGFSGGELVRLLAGHPNVEIGFLGGLSSAGKTLAQVHPHLASMAIADRALEPIDEPSAISERAELAFLCLPHGVSSEIAPALLEAGTRVVDLAGDFRLAAEYYPQWYGFEHPSPAWLSKAVYGLPEAFGAQIANAQLVANPGCFPTPVVLGLSPLLSDGLVEPGTIRVDGKTGMSGAGRAASEEMSFNWAGESIRPYRAPDHQHTPEMERGIELATGLSPSIAFVPHLVPAVRGVLTTCYATAASGVTTEDLAGCLASAYAGRPFVRVLPPGGMVDSKRTRGANVVEIQAFVDERTSTAVVIGALDNLVKGAAGQAIQNMNLMFGLDESTALPTSAVYP